MILDHILSHQRSPHDKSGIGFDKPQKNYEEGESPQPSQGKIEEKSRSHKYSREMLNKDQDGHNQQKGLCYKRDYIIPGMKIILMVIAMHVVVLVTGLWNAPSMEEEVLEFKVTQLDVEHVTKLGILLLIATH